MSNALDTIYKVLNETVFAKLNHFVHQVKYFPFKIKTIQTDNGFEFTNRLNWNIKMQNKKTIRMVDAQ